MTWTLVATGFLVLLPHFEACVGFRTGFSLHLSGIFVYLVLGGVLFKFADTLRTHFLWASTASAAAFFAGTGWIVARELVEPGDFVARYVSVPTCLIAMSVFTFALLLHGRLQSGSKVQAVAGWCWGIYLFHQALINILFKVIRFNPAERWPLISVPLTVVLLFGLTAVPVAVARKVPAVRKYLL